MKKLRVFLALTAFVLAVGAAFTSTAFVKTSLDPVEVSRDGDVDCLPDGFCSNVGPGFCEVGEIDYNVRVSDESCDNPALGSWSETID